jgi:hypothetical protein
MLDILSVVGHSEYGNKYRQLAIDYYTDAALKVKLETQPKAVLAAREVLVVPEQVEIKVLANSNSLFYFVLPPNPNIALSDEKLEQIAAAGVSSAGSAGSVGTLGSFGCSSVPCTVGSAGTAGTASTAK